MGIKSQIIEKCKTEKSRNVLLSQLALIERSVKDNKVLDRVNGDEVLAIRTQLHWELHDLNGGGNKTYATEHIAGLVGLILITRAWDGYLTGTGLASSQSFKAFLADNGLDLEHVQYCLDKCARELMDDFAKACTMSTKESGAFAQRRQSTGEAATTLRDQDDVGGDSRRRLKQLVNKAQKDHSAAHAYKQYLAGEISLSKALRDSGLRRPTVRDRVITVMNTLSPKARELSRQYSAPEQFVQFALNYVVDQFKEGIPPDLLDKYVSESAPN